MKRSKFTDEQILAIVREALEAREDREGSLGNSGAREAGAAEQHYSEPLAAWLVRQRVTRAAKEFGVATTNHRPTSGRASRAARTATVLHHVRGGPAC
jgi:hypothetical protein